MAITGRFSRPTKIGKKNSFGQHEILDRESLEGVTSPVTSIAIGPGSSQARLTHLPEKEKLSSGGSILTYRISRLVKGSEFHFTVNPKYTPILIGEELGSTLNFKNSDTPWYY